MEENGQSRYRSLPIEQTYRGKLLNFGGMDLFVLVLFLFVFNEKSSNDSFLHPMMYIAIIIWIPTLSRYAFMEIRVTPEGLLELSRLTKYERFVRFEAITRIAGVTEGGYRYVRKYYEIQSLDGDVRLNCYSNWKDLLKYILPKINEGCISDEIEKKLS